MKLASSLRSDGVLLLLWTAIGLVLRFTNLTAKPLWTDEFSTIVFSLGNSFLPIPLDQVLSSAQLLQPLQPVPQAGVGSVLENLFGESNHPPLYFVLAHLWMRLFPTTSEGLVSTMAARSLPALLGALSIPAVFLLSRMAFRSSLVGQISALLMAVSPFGIYLAQEARHYALSVLWVTASLGCLVIATRTIRDRTSLPWSLCFTWIAVNGLGIATHYFFSLTLGAEALVISTMGLVQSWRERGIWHSAAHWNQIWVVVAGTMAAGLIWLPMLQEIQDSDLTRWIQQGNRSGLVWLEPIAQAAAGWITMLYLLPVQGTTELIMIVCGASLILLTLWTLPKLYRGLAVQSLDRNRRLAVWSLSGFVIGAVGLFFAITYLFSTNLTSAFRYNFVYYPAVIVLAGAGLASSWDIAARIAKTAAHRVSPVLLSLIRTSGRQVVVLVALLSFLGGLTVLANLGYQKTHRPDVVAQEIQERSQGDTLVTIVHQTHGQTGRLMGVAWELLQSTPAENSSAPLIPHFLLAHQTQNQRSVIMTLRKAMTELPRPLDLWVINFQTVPEPPLNRFLEQQNCDAETKNLYTDGYRFRLYRCKTLTRKRL
ncbi:glycosyltransferase [Phormidium tenue FACHB-886]|nr:glycosyltransferase [Phormidium tenue FACHB-886]